MYRRAVSVAGVLLGATLAAAGAPLRPGPPGGAPSGPVLAAEDTLRVYVAPETTRVAGRRVPLSEIIRKAQQGERRKYDGISSIAFNRTIKLTLLFGRGDKAETRCIENVSRVYYRAPGDWAEALLRETRTRTGSDGVTRPWEEDEDDDGIRVEAGEDQGRRLSEVPAYLEDVEKFDFRILNRSLQRDQVLYEIAFQPKSDFEILPGGRVWVLTGAYQIVHEEYELRNLPVPWLLRDVGLLVREWQQVDGRWFPRRVTARATLRDQIGLGLVDVPHTAEIVVLFDAYRLDPDLDPALFESRKP